MTQTNDIHAATTVSASGDEQWIFELAAKHETPNGALFGPVTFSSTTLVDFVRDVAAVLALSRAADGQQGASAALPGQAKTSAAYDVLAERQRQVSAEGWTPEHDDEHADFQLSRAATYYALAGHPMIWPGPAWPWSMEWWKPRNKRNNLVRAGALILAEIERLDRASAPVGDLTVVDCPACDGKAACDECSGQGKIIVSRADMAALAPIEHDHREGGHHD